MPGRRIPAGSVFLVRTRGAVPTPLPNIKINYEMRKRVTPGTRNLCPRTLKTSKECPRTFQKLRRTLIPRNKCPWTRNQEDIGSLVCCKRNQCPRNQCPTPQYIYYIGREARNKCPTRTSISRNKSHRTTTP